MNINKFKKNKRGYYSLVIFLTLFVLSLSAQIIANDKPLIVKFKGEFYFPFLVSHYETDFGGVLPTEADFKDPEVKKLIDDAGGWVLFAPIKYNYSTISFDVNSPAPSAPSLNNLLGTDDQGRDVLARLIYGFRISVIFGLVLTFFSLIAGIFLGAIQGYFAGVVDLVLQRFTEVWSSMPVLFLLIILASVIEPNFWMLLIIMLLFSWMGLASLVRAEFLRTRNFEYVMAARALGASRWRVIFRHILPNSLASTFASLPFMLSGSIVVLTSLDFLGFGMPVSSPSLGELLAQGKNNLNAPWLGITGFVVISTLLTLLVFIGEAIRDSFDVR